MISRLLQISVFIFLSCLSQFGFGQDGSFSASVDRNNLALGEQLEVTFTLNGSSGGSNFRPPSFSDFLTLSGPNQSTNMQFINGAMEASVSYGYTLQPREAGKFVIGPAFISYKGKQLQTQPIAIEVTKGAPQTKSQTRGTQPDADIGKQIGDNLFLKVSVDKARVYQGEQLTATYKIYTRVNISNYNLTKVPALTGFWSEDLDLPKQVQLSTEVVNGKQYRVGVLKKVALFPQRSGALTLDPMEIECVVQVQGKRRSSDIFDQFFNDPFFGGVSNVNHKVRSEPLTVNVAPLPLENLPAGYSGAVGKFTMDSWLDKSQTRTNEPVNLKVKISGKGNIKLLDAPAVIVSSDVEKYDPKITDNITKDGNQIGGSRTFEYLLMPRHPGDQKIPSVMFSYFDIAKKSYVSLKSPDFNIRVDKGDDITPTYASGVSKEDVKLLGEDIRFIKSGKISFHKKGEAFFGSTPFFVLWVAPVLGFVGFLILLKRREKIMGDLALVKNRKARKTAQKRLTLAKSYLDAKKNEEFYTELSRALWGYAADKLSIPPSGLSLELVRSVLEQKNIEPELITKLTSTIDTCDFARFAPGPDALRMDHVYNETVELISKIEASLR